ncbi:autotransporter outer membrane beta-barrel domain-containing protein [Pseudomonas sp. CFBP13509]|uniref:autotransporter outer membrane beta-barrel domain-containing protein n=1 Tax=Pseudomonas sp. CFBP13509 TaxID=2184008 RepID=UPI0010BFC95F|nr:autotransporter outer membrane beta-barrel domain-containing protein [Pseudomonas sp. CFBP13509]TKJ78049.1 autotransporter outer membrane beta-barrel domain-containing protein [Pseudomonas sp. CFBP13509]
MQVPSVVTLLFLAPGAHARLIENGTETIDHDAYIDTFELQNATLNVIDGRTLDVYANASSLNVSQNSLIMGTVVAQGGSNVNVGASRVTASGAFQTGITLLSSAAQINDSVISSAEYHGMVVGKFTTSTQASTATANGSVIVGATGGAAVTGGSLLETVNSQVVGTGADSFGLSLQSATARAYQSNITGGRNGVEMSYDRYAPGANTLLLDQTHVTGVTGAALLVQGARGQGAVADIVVRNGSTLTGGNGNLLEVKGNSTANMRVENSRLQGDVIVESGSQAHLKLNDRASLIGRMENVSSLEVGDESLWIMTGHSQVGDLRLADGVVKFGDDDAFYRLDLERLSGQGTFAMGTDFARGLTDFLNISGEATGHHGLLLASSGAEPGNPGAVHIVHTGGGDAQFELLGGAVDVGAWSYGLKQEGNDWFLDPNNRTVSPGTRSVLALFNTAPTVWYGEMTSLRSRMGDLRYSGVEAGGWLRAYGNKYEISGGDGGAYDQNQRGFSLGADTPVGDGQWLLGVMAGHSTSDLDLSRGTSGTVQSYYAGLYATWLDEESGYYLDGVVKANRLNNNAKVGLSDGKQTKGNYSTNALGASVEVGRHIKLDDDFFVEPFAQASVVTVQGKSYRLDNGLKAKNDHTDSVLGKLGVTVGRDFVLDDGSVLQPYLRAGVAHEFVKNNKVMVNNQTFDNNLSGSRIEVGAGFSVSLSQNLQVHADFDYGQGKHVDQPWGANVGVRYNW